MKKRFMLILVSCLVCLLACSCGGSSQSSDTSDSSSADNATTETQSASEVINLGDAVVAEDDNAIVTVSQFYSQEFSGEMHSFVTFNIKNKLDDKKVYLNLESAYIGDDPITVVHHNGGGNVLPGKTGQTDFLIYRENGGEPVPLDSLDELYGLNGELEIRVFESENKIESRNMILFDLSNLK